MPHFISSPLDFCGKQIATPFCQMLHYSANAPHFQGEKCHNPLQSFTRQLIFRKASTYSTHGKIKVGRKSGVFYLMKRIIGRENFIARGHNQPYSIIFPRICTLTSFSLFL